MSKGKTSHKNGLVPRLRFPEFRDAGEWESLTGDKIFEPISNKNHNSELPVLAITQDHGAIPRELINYHITVMEKSIESYKVVEVDDFIISLRSFQGGIEHSKYRGICSPAYVVLRKRENAKAEIEFFRHYFKTSGYIRNLTKNIEGIRDGKMVSFNQFSEVLLPIPKPEEQQKIAHCLSSLDALIDAQSKKLDALKSHKKGLMQLLFPCEGEAVPRLRFPEFRDAGEWKIKYLHELAENLDNRRIPITESERVKGTTPYFGASGVVDYVQGHIFDEELLCISEDGANLLARTTPIAFTISGKTWVNNHAHVLKFDSKHLHEITKNYLNFISLEDYLTGMAQPKLNRAKLDIIPVPIPKSPEEQKVVANSLSSFDALMVAESEKLDALKAHKKGLLQQLFPSPEDIAA